MNPNAELLEQAASLADMGHLSEARDFVRQAIENDDRDAEAWYALTQLAGSDTERRKAIYQLWSLDPNHPEANYLLDKLKAGTLPPLGNQAGFSSRKVKAEKHYAAYPKDYMMPAIITLVAYWVFWLVGLVMNIYFLREAGRLENETGLKQDNVGCLKALAGVYIAMPIVIIIFVVIIIILTEM